MATRGSATNLSPKAGCKGRAHGGGRPTCWLRPTARCSCPTTRQARSTGSGTRASSWPAAIRSAHWKRVALSFASRRAQTIDRGGNMFLHRSPLARIGAVAIFAVCAIFALPALAADLTVGLGTDVTAIDPHYHNLTPNNNVAAHIFGYLVQRNEKSQLEPGLATEWKTVDPLTWEFKLRKGVKFHDGSDFTAADVVASDERVPTVAERPVTVS